MVDYGAELSFGGRSAPECPVGWVGYLVVKLPVLQEETFSSSSTTKLAMDFGIFSERNRSFGRSFDRNQWGVLWARQLLQ